MIEKYRHGGTGAQVEAMQLTAENIQDIAFWCPSAMIVTEIDPFTSEEMPALNITTASGRERVSIGQYVVKANGQFYMDLPGHFRRNFIPVEVPPGPVSKSVRDSKILRDRTDEDEL